MKPWIFTAGSLGLALCALPFLASSDVATNQPDSTATAAIVAPAAAQAPVPAALPAGTNSAMPAPPAFAMDKPLPPAINPASPTADVVKLAQAGVTEDVLLAYVNNSGSTFNLGSQDIISLNDLGVPDAVVKAMIQRDHSLKAPADLTPSAPPAAPPTEVASETPPPMAEAPAMDTAPPPADMQAADSLPADLSYDASYSDFYNTLSPYGNWVDLPDYGWCWQPYAVCLNAGWQPYCDRGRWLYTDCGWYWHSDYSWGSVAFHYGRWFHDDRRGWCWWPDRTWGPAWVSWRSNHSYCGWAVLPPRAGFRPGIGLSVGLHADLGLNASAFTFVPLGALGDPHPARHRVPQNQVAAVFNNTSVINDIAAGNHHAVVNRGIAPEEVTQITHREIPRVNVHDLHDGPGEHFSHNGHTVVANSQNRFAPGIPVAGRPSPADVQAYGSVGAIQRSYVPQGITRQNIQPSRPMVAPEVVHGNYAPSPSINAGVRAAPETRNVTVIGQSFAPAHTSSPYVTYSTGQPAGQARYETPTVGTYASQPARFYSQPAQSYSQPASAPAPRQETRNPYYTYSTPATYSQPVREVAVPERSAPVVSYYPQQTARYYSPPAQSYAAPAGVPEPRYESRAPSYSPPATYYNNSQAPARASQSSSSAGSSPSRGNGYGH